LSTYLIGISDFNDIVKESGIDNLSVVVGGPIAPNPAELLERSLFEQFINKARELYDYIILDNAPISLVSDGILTASQADINLFILREGHSHKEQIKYINQLSESKLVKNIALIYNDARKTGFGYGNRSKYYNYGYGNRYNYNELPQLQEKTVAKLKQ
jgi:Mrp family chromosome partitioning ATPase